MNTTNTFTAIDFETAQGKRNSICQIGLVRVEQGVIVNRISVLVKPPQNYYSFYNTQVHGISADMTRNAMTFDRIWPSIAPYICDQNVVAHNSSFDISCLKQTLAYYGLITPGFTSHCTYRIYGQKLNRLCQTYKIDLQHHDALSDALACAKLFMLHTRQQQGVNRGA